MLCPDRFLLMLGMSAQSMHAHPVLAGHAVFGYRGIGNLPFRICCRGVRGVDGEDTGAKCPVSAIQALAELAQTQKGSSSHLNRLASVKQPNLSCVHSGLFLVTEQNVFFALP